MLKMAHIAYSRLCAHLQDIAASMLDAWSIVFPIGRVRLNAFGLQNGT